MIPTTRRRRRGSERGQGTLVGLIVAIAIIVILAAWLYPKYMKPSAAGDTAESSAEQQAAGTACSIYYRQIGDAIVEHKDSTGHVPPSLAALSKEGVTSDMYSDPACGFTYDPQTGMLGDKETPLPSAPSAPVPGAAGVPGAPVAGTPTPETAPGAPAPNVPSTDPRSKIPAQGGSNIPPGLINGDSAQ